MFNWLFKKRDRTAAPATSAPAATTRSTPVPAGKRAAAAPPAPAPKPVVVDLTDWPAKLRDAQGNDAALLQLATATPVLDIKIAAVEALTGEETLKQAEREFRSHDRKVHRIAKKRLEAAVAQRVARATAASLIERTTALIGNDQVAMNQVIDLDRTWQALPADMLLAEQRASYAELRTRLDTEIRDRSDEQQRVQRWLADTRLALPELQRTIAGAAEQGLAADLAPACVALQALADTRPDAPATADLGATLARALQDAAAVESRLAWFEAEPEPAVARPPRRVASAATDVDTNSATPEPVVTTDAAPVPTPDVTSSEALTDEEPVADAATDTEAVAAAAAPTSDAPATAADTAVEAAPVAAPPVAESSEPPVATPAQRWAELPAPTDSALVRVLEQRFEQWQRARRPVRLPAKPVAAASMPAKADKPARPARPEPLTPEQLSRVEALVQQGEATLADGHLGELQQQLGAIDAALGKAGAGALGDALRARLQVLRAEGARLKGWQQWGGGRARDDLTDQAEALAKSTLAASDPEQPDAPKVDVKAQREAIHNLRLRWKELDRLGAPANQTLWQRFDAALQTASVPVAAHHAVLAAARKDNQAAREALLAALEALPLPGSAGAANYQQASDRSNDGDGDGQGNDQGDGGGENRAALADETHGAVDSDSGSGSGSGSDSGPGTGAHGGGNRAREIEWKDLARELGNFQAAWRKLGPLEHTAPADAREALQQRHRVAIERIEAPLQAARRAAVAVREQLIAQALSLVPEPGRQRLVPDATRLVRELQAQWQDHARRLPLARAVENEVWTRFKAATDAVFAQREAVFAARDAEFAANLAAAEAVLDRLGALNAETPRAEVERAIAEADRAWREGGELPRGALDGIERRFRGARAAASDLLAAGVRARWQAQCDSLSARLALCTEREAAASEGSTPDELAQRWSALGKLPAAWDRPLAQRWSAPAAAGPLAEVAVDELLLHLEAALDLPTTPAWQAERSKLKLRALKDAMEGRRTDRPDGPALQGEQLAALLRQSNLMAQQHERLQALVAALRQATPGVLGSPVLAD